MKLIALFRQYPEAKRKKIVDDFLASLSDAEIRAWQRWFRNETVDHIHILRTLRGKPFCLIKGGLYYRRPTTGSPYSRGPHRPNGGGRAA
ncbi:MAG: hypothetical protein SV201_05785 [Pseudomonadota bacterium]|nr:hypothetical protein [Pseudomonadota bacterium]